MPVLRKDNNAELAAALRRTAWEAHKNYPGQVLLLGSHDNFRRISSHLVEESAQCATDSPHVLARRDLLDLFTRWKSAMKNHERYEEGKLYPYLHAKYGTEVAFLEAHHRQLTQAEARVHVAYDENDSQMAADAFRLHDEILVPHLAQEEVTVIPLLLAMTLKEFNHYSHSGISLLLSELRQS